MWILTAQRVGASNPPHCSKVNHIYSYIIYFNKIDLYLCQLTSVLQTIVCNLVVGHEINEITPTLF